MITELAYMKAKSVNKVRYVSSNSTGRESAILSASGIVLQLVKKKKGCLTVESNKAWLADYHTPDIRASYVISVRRPNAQREILTFALSFLQLRRGWP